MASWGEKTARALTCALMAWACLTGAAGMARAEASSAAMTKGLSVGEGTPSGHATLSPGVVVTSHVTVSLPAQANDLDGCRYAITDELPSGADLLDGTVRVALVTPGATSYDLTDAFESYPLESGLRVQCEELREHLPRALVAGSAMDLRYQWQAPADPSELASLDGQVTYAHVTLTPKAGSAVTQAYGDAGATTRVVTLVVDDEGADDGEVCALTSGDITIDADFADGHATLVGVPEGASELIAGGQVSEVNVGMGEDGGRLTVEASGMRVAGVSVSGDSTVTLTLGTPGEPEATGQPPTIRPMALGAVAASALALVWAVSREARATSSSRSSTQPRKYPMRSS